MDKLKTLLFQKQSIGVLVFFRIIFGLVLFVEVTRFFDHNWIERYYMEPQFYFTYDGFSWLKPWPGEWMVLHFYVLGTCALMIALGLFYRLSTIIFFLGFTMVFLLDKTNYLNHFYLISLLSFILIFLPANGAFSLDAKFFPKVKRRMVPGWTIWWLRAQLGLVYFFGGVAKINPDWLRGEPMRMWLARRTDFPIIGGLFEYEWMVYFMSYSGLLLDLLIFPALLFKKTRLPAFLIITTFHLMNSQLFEIGIFPWFMLGATAIFFPSHLFEFWMSKKPVSKKKKTKTKADVDPTRIETTPVRQLILGGLSVWFFIQVALPFRHWLFEGNVNWTEEGHRFSWHMKLRSKRAVAKFYIFNKDSKELIEVKQKDFLTSRQRKKVKLKPDMIWQFAQVLKQTALDSGIKNPAIYAEVACQLNGREAQFLVDPRFDLGSVEWEMFKHSDWIMPLEKELK